MNVLIVRAAADARRTATRLAAAGHRPVVAPILEIEALDPPLPSGDFDALVATSAHAFGPWAPLASLRTLPLLVVGARTADAARRAGCAAPLVLAADAADLAAKAKGILRPAARLLYLAGRDRKPDLENAFCGAFALTVVEIYAAEPVAALPEDAVRAFESGKPDAILHYSQRSAAILLDLARRAGLGGTLGAPRHIAISADAAAPLMAAGLPVAVAARPNEDSMIEELARIETADAKGAGGA